MCEYCGCRSIELIGRFTEEHYSVIDRLGDLGRACSTGDLGAVGQAGVRLANLLWPHTKAEEVGLFHEMRKEEEYAPTIDALCAEHSSLDEQLERVIDGDLDEFPAFEKALRAHIDHEENGLFPAAAVGIDGPTWERINQLTHDFDHAEGIEHQHGEGGQGLGESAHAHEHH
ncbi:hemerythrin domain-containing protein [Luteococcus sp. Sow4_B9]|uniref:hemerythrin domain-containing protein n=1 Tax=Luteococcus sp. Sow4_B9 TaxID=3438792 RepID=UPI003F988B65